MAMALRKVRAAANFENANFSRIWDDSEQPRPASESEVTEFIRRRTEMYRQTWVNPLMDLLIAYAEGKISAREIEPYL